MNHPLFPATLHTEEFTDMTVFQSFLSTTQINTALLAVGVGLMVLAGVMMIANAPATLKTTTTEVQMEKIAYRLTELSMVILGLGLGMSAVAVI